MTTAVQAPPRTVPGFLSWRAALEPDHVAIEVRGAGPEPAVLTLGQWEIRASAVAAALRERGIGYGDRVGLLFGTGGWIDYAVAYCGVQRAGAVAVPMSDRLASVQISFILRQCDAAAMILGDSSTAAMPLGVSQGRTAAAAKSSSRLPDAMGASSGYAGAWLDQGGLPGLRWAATVQDLTSVHPIDAACDQVGAAPGGDGPPRQTEAPRPGDLAQILYTSGTTGQPKGVAATHANLSLGAPVHPRRLRLAHSARFAHAFAIGTNAAQTMLLNALYARPGAVVPAQVTPLRFARLLASPEVGTVFVVPSLAIELLNSGALDGRDLSHVQLVGSTAAPLPPAVASRLAAAFPGAAIVNYYTSTEAAPAEVSMIFDASRPAALGRPAEGELMIVDDEGRPAARGATGEVWLRSRHPRAYYRDEAATRDTFGGEGGEWVRMGDLGRIDADGYLYLADRHQDVVKSGAFKVSTLEVEAALHEHPHVADAAVVGVPDPVLGAVLAAFVVPGPLAPAGEPTLPSIRGFLATRLAGYQIPARIALCDLLPRNEGGKVLKRQLAESLTEPKEGHP